MRASSDTLLLIGDPQGRIIRVSPAFARLSGHTAQALLGQPINLLRHPQMPGGPFKDLWATLAQGQSWMGMLQNRRADGEAFWVEAYISPIVENGQLLEYQAVYRLPSAQRIARASEVYRARAAGRQPTALRWPRLPAALRGSLAATLAFLPLALLAGTGQAVLASAAYVCGAALCWGLLHLHNRALASLVAESRQRVRHPIKQLIYTGRTDETGQLRLSGELLEARLEALTTRIHDSSGQVAEQAGQACQAIHASQRDAEEQLLALGEIATATNQFSSTAQEIADNTQEAARLTREAETLAGTGHQRIDQASADIARLSDGLETASRQVDALARQNHDIAGVLDVIRGIAEQTNLLALNAAIEAARAGENGRGFAVVADEVRSLAQRTHRSTDEVRQLIEALHLGTAAIVQAMQQGLSQSAASVDSVQAAASALQAIQETVSRISDTSTQIASATEQQGSVAEEINRKLHAVHQLAERSARQLEDGLAQASGVDQQAQRQQALIDHLQHG